MASSFLLVVNSARAPSFQHSAQHCMSSRTWEPSEPTGMGKQDESFCHSSLGPSICGRGAGPSTQRSGMTGCSLVLWAVADQGGGAGTQHSSPQGPRCAECSELLPKTTLPLAVPRPQDFPAGQGTERFLCLGFASTPGLLPRAFPCRAADLPFLAGRPPSPSKKDKSQ